MESQRMMAAQLPCTPANLRRSLRHSNSPKLKTFSSLKSSTHLKLQKDDTNLDFTSKKGMFILGMGYVGQFFAHHLKAQGWDVTGTCTSVTKKRILEEKGLDVHVFDALEPDHLLVSVPPTEGIGDPILKHEEFVKSILMDGDLRWLCYLSTTSVYGDASGAWVDENYTPKPLTNLAKKRLESEEGWLKLGHDLGLTSYVFRLGGIYGPGRSAIDTILKKGGLSERQNKRATKKFTSRVHVVDICEALKASFKMQQQRNIYNVVDDDPASREVVFAFAQQLIGRRWPSLIIPTNNYEDASTIRRGAEKRVCNANIKNELGLKLVYPCYRSGLQSIIDTMEGSILYSDSENKC